MKKLVSISLIVYFFVHIFIAQLYSQSIDRGGREFWLTSVPRIYSDDPTKAQPPKVHSVADTLRIVIYSNSPANVEISITGTSWKKSINTKDSLLYIVTLPKDSVVPYYTAFPENKSVHVTADQDIQVACYSMIGVGSDATIIYPESKLGKEYRICSHFIPNRQIAFYDPAYLIVLATEPQTVVNITPPGSDWGGPKQLTLQQGQTYFLHNRSNPTSTVISANKPVAVFIGGVNQNPAEWTIPGFFGAGGGNWTYEQQLPVEQWSQKYYAVQMDASAPGKRNPTWTRILAANNSTTVKINGISILLNSNQWFDTMTVVPLAITSDKPITVTQMGSGMGDPPGNFNPYLRGNMGDGTISQVLGQEKMLSGKTEFSTIPYFGPNDSTYPQIGYAGRTILDYVCIIAPTPEIKEIYLDGKSIASQFTTFEFDAAMSYAQIPIAKWKHEIWSTGRYHLYTYGWNDAEAYSNVAGVGLGARKATMSYASPCVGEEFELRGVAHKGAIKWHWDFADGSAEIQTTTLGTTPADDDYTTVAHSFSKAGTYPVRIRVLYDWSQGVEDTIWRNVIVPELPAVTLKADKPILCHGESTRLRAATGFKRYTWSYNGEALQTNSVTPHEQTVFKSGEYAVTITDEKGCANTATVRVTILPEIIAGITGARQSCINSTETYRAEGITNPATMTLGWTATGGTIISGQGTAAVAVLWNGQGTGLLKLEMRDETTGCFKDTTMSVEIGTGLNVTIAGKLVICEGTPTLLKAESGAGSDAQFEWSFNGEVLKDEKAQTLTALQAGNYRVRVTSATGCTGETTAEVTSAQLPQKPYIAGQPILCDENSTTMLSLQNPQQYARYEWSFKNAVISNESELAVTQPGTYTLTVYNAEGCSAETEANVILLTLSISNDTTICSGQPVQLSAITSSEEQLLYKWTPAIGLNNANILNPIATPGETTTYTLEVSTHDRFCVKKDSVRIEVVKAPQIQTNDISLCEGESAVLDVTSDEQNITWSWTPTDGLSNPNVQNPILTAFKSQVYTVTATNESGCETTKQVGVIVTPQENITAVLQSDKAELEPGESTLVKLLVQSENSTGITSFKTTISYDEKVFQFTKNSEKFLKGADNTWRVSAFQVNNDLHIEASGTTPLSETEVAIELTAYLAKQTTDEFIAGITELNGQPISKDENCRIIREEPTRIQLKDVCAGDMRLVSIGQHITQLQQVKPNPVTENRLEVEYSLGIDGDIALELYNARGERIKTLYIGQKKAGTFTETLQTNELSSGIYFLRLVTQQATQMQVVYITR